MKKSLSKYWREWLITILSLTVLGTGIYILYKEYKEMKDKPELHIESQSPYFNSK